MYNILILCIIVKASSETFHFSRQQRVFTMLILLSLLPHQLKLSLLLLLPFLGWGWRRLWLRCWHICVCSPCPFRLSGSLTFFNSFNLHLLSEAHKTLGNRFCNLFLTVMVKTITTNFKAFTFKGTWLRLMCFLSAIFSTSYGIQRIQSLFVFVVIPAFGLLALSVSRCNYVSNDVLCCYINNFLKCDVGVDYI